MVKKFLETDDSSDTKQLRDDLSEDEDLDGYNCEAGTGHLLD